MKIRNFTHKGLKRFYEDGNEKGVPVESRGKLRNMVGFLEAMADIRELSVPILKWKAHALLGDRRGTWSLSVTANLRLTFRVDDQKMLSDLNLEDYH